jgi:2-dehydro-3-deoxygluconokinase
VSQLKPGDVDWEKIFVREGARWFHTGGIFCALSQTTAEVAQEAMQRAKSAGVGISYDLNYRPSLWQSIGGKPKAQEVNRELASLVDVLIGNEEDFTAALGFSVQGLDENLLALDAAKFRSMLDAVRHDFPNLSLILVTLRTAHSASRNDWGAIACDAQGKFYEATPRKNLDIYDRIGGGDSFASGFLYGLLTGQDVQWSLECGAAHGALAMTTPGDCSMATLHDVLNLMKGQSARIVR